MDAAVNSKATIEPELDEVITSLDRCAEALGVITEDGDDVVSLAAVASMVSESIAAQVERLEALVERLPSE